jgi:hypothetical protein
MKASSSRLLVTRLISIADILLLISKVIQIYSISSRPGYDYHHERITAAKLM